MSTGSDVAGPAPEPKEVSSELSEAQLRLYIVEQRIEALQRENEELKRLSGIALGHLECTTGDHRIDAVRVLREAFGLPVTPLGEAP